MDSLLDLGYFGLFVGSFLASTVVPFSADALLVGMLAAGGSPWIVIAVATIGNSLGGITSYVVGRLGKWKWIERFGASRESIEKYKAKIDNYGVWTALLSWLPIVGDVIAIALGFFRVNFYSSAILMLVGRFARFVAWYLIYAQF